MQLTAFFFTVFRGYFFFLLTNTRLKIGCLNCGYIIYTTTVYYWFIGFIDYLQSQMKRTVNSVEDEAH